MIQRGKQGVTITKSSIYSDSEINFGCKHCGAKVAYHGYCDRCWLTHGKQELITELEKIHKEVKAEENKLLKRFKKILRCA